MPGEAKAGDINKLFDLSGRVAIVTGGGSGYGEDIARWLAGAGAAVMVADINEANAARAVGELVPLGRVEKVIGDVSRKADIDAMVAATVRTFGSPDIVVNNAGYAQTFGPLLDVSEEEFDKLFAVNVKSIFHMSKAVLPAMIERRRGVIINIASTAGLRPRPNLTWYNATKGSVITLTKSMAGELATSGVRVNALCPGAGDTPLYREKFFAGQDLEQIGTMLRATIPMGRLVEPGDIGAAALYLASDAASYLTGVCLEIDGGRNI